MYRLSLNDDVLLRPVPPRTAEGCTTYLAGWVVVMVQTKQNKPSQRVTTAKRVSVRDLILFVVIKIMLDDWNDQVHFTAGGPLACVGRAVRWWLGGDALHRHTVLAGVWCAIIALNHLNWFEHLMLSPPRRRWRRNEEEGWFVWLSSQYHSLDSMPTQRRMKGW